MAVVRRAKSSTKTELRMRKVSFYARASIIANGLLACGHESENTFPSQTGLLYGASIVRSSVLGESNSGKSGNSVSGTFPGGLKDAPSGMGGAGGLA